MDLSPLVSEQWLLVDILALGRFFDENCSQYNSYSILITLIQRRNHRSMGIGQRKQQSHCPYTP